MKIITLYPLLASFDFPGTVHKPVFFLSVTKYWLVLSRYFFEPVVCFKLVHAAVNWSPLEGRQEKKKKHYLIFCQEQANPLLLARPLCYVSFGLRTCTPILTWFLLAFPIQRLFLNVSLCGYVESTSKAQLFALFSHLLKLLNRAKKFRLREK